MKFVYLVKMSRGGKARFAAHAFTDLDRAKAYAVGQLPPPVRAAVTWADSQSESRMLYTGQGMFPWMLPYIRAFEVV